MTRGRPLRRWTRWVLWPLLVALVLPVALVALYRFVPPPVPPLMLIRESEGEPLQQRWVPLSRVSPALARAVIAS